MARYHAKSGNIFFSILPGILDHAGSAWDKKRIESPKYYEDKKAMMPLGRFLKPEEIASILADLVNSDSMAISGSIIKLDGAL